MVLRPFDQIGTHAALGIERCARGRIGAAADRPDAAGEGFARDQPGRGRGADPQAADLGFGHVGDDHQRIQLDHRAAGAAGREERADFGFTAVEHPGERGADIDLFQSHFGLAHRGAGRVEVGLVLQHLGLRAVALGGEALALGGLAADPQDGARRIDAGAIVAIVCVLVCVFLPVAFLGGIAGVLYRQFAVTVALSVTLSGFVALTLTPTLCALLLRPHAPGASGGRLGGLVAGFGRGFGAVAAWHGRVVRWLLDHPRSAAGAFLAIVVANIVLVVKIPRSFLPPEDQGYLLAMVALPDGAGINRTKTFMDGLTPKLRENPAVRHTFAISGFDLLGGGERTNSGTIFLPLKDFGQRPPGGEALARQLNAIGMTQPDGMCLVVNPPAIRGIGTAGGFEFYLQAKEDDDPARLAANIEKLEGALRARPELTGIRVFLRPSVPQFLAEVDEVRAAALGVTLPDLHEALQATIGVVYANDFTLSGRTYRVLVQSEAADRMDAAAAGRVHVRAANGGMVPLSSFVKFKPSSGPEQLERHMGFLSARLICSPAPGVSSGDAIALVERIAEDIMPVGYGIDWTAQALQEKRAATSALPAFLLALLMVFLILAALYEDLALPLGVLLTVPFALLGALLAVLVRGMPNDIYFQIGLVTLIGLAAKNAILIVEFAETARRAGRSAADAAVEAARMRIRPLVMTSMAFVLGVVPLAFAGGAGAAARQSMGTGVLGGMLLDTFVATLFIPWFFHLLSGRKDKPTPAQP